MCYNPIIIKNKTNKWQIKTEYIEVACRQCLQCKQQRANEWAVLCWHELKNHKQSMFLTLTYENSPTTLQKKDLQDFFKRLRKYLTSKVDKNIKIKYFACGEYGEKRMRPHYHIIIFGYSFNDVWEETSSPKGYKIFQSPTLNKIWGKGRTTVQSVSFNSIAYCALYSSTPRKALPLHLQSAPEFNLMSQSLGVSQILKKIDTYLLTDEIYINNFSYRIPTKVLKKHFEVSSDIENYNLPNEYICVMAKRRKESEIALKITDENIGIYAKRKKDKYISESKQKRNIKII